MGKLYTGGEAGHSRNSKNMSRSRNSNEAIDRNGDRILHETLKNGTRVLYPSKPSALREARGPAVPQKNWARSGSVPCVPKTEAERIVRGGVVLKKIARDCTPL